MSPDQGASQICNAINNGNYPVSVEVLIEPDVNGRRYHEARGVAGSDGDRDNNMIKLGWW